MNKETYVDFLEIIHGCVELKSCSNTKQCDKKHLHHELSIGFIREGSTTVVLGEKTITFKKGDGVIIPPFLSHLCTPDDLENWGFDMLYIKPIFYEKFLDFNTAEKIDKNDAIIIDKFIKYINSEDNESVREEKLIDLLICLNDLIKTPPEDNKNKAFVVKDFIDNHFKEKLSLDMLEKEFNKTRFQIIREFKKQYNTTPMAYQLQLKVSKAKQYLLDGTSVLDICDLLGFYDQAHFIREFKKMNGVTPQKYLDKIL
ncbi:MAG: helix-turn-helix domain-containing protein [Pleomorphochaeta sp.]